MKILIITPSYKPAYRYGGPTVSVSELAEALVSIGHSVTVYTTTADGKAELIVPVASGIRVDGVLVYYFKRVTGDHTHISPALWAKLWKTTAEFDIIHLQSWWSLLILGVALICRVKKKAFVLSPRGMLSSYSFKSQHGFSKKLLHYGLGKKLLKSSILHATTQMEWRDCMRVHKDWKGFIAHNLINLPLVPANTLISKTTQIFTLGFLSRIDPKKGIELLLKALSDIPFDFRLKIAGVGDDQYIASLKALASELFILDKIEWCGWKSHYDKFLFLQTIDIFTLTSFNENFAIAVAEALAIGTPVLVSNKVGLADYVDANKLGWVCEMEPGSIRDILVKIHNSGSDIKRIRDIAPNLIAEDFNKKKLAQEYVRSYQNVIR